MKEKDITMMGIKEVSAMIKYKEISPVEVVEECVKRTKELQPGLNAYISFLEEGAIKEAKVAEKEIMKGGPKSPLHGIPIALKDLFYTKGILTSAGSKLLSDFIPDYDSTITERLNQAGAILMGKTNTHEFAFGPTCEHSYYGACHNPWDPSRITGGSSGGSAIAVATGMAYMAMGSDTGGSVRIPSAFCGTVGFKPTYGLASLFGVIPVSFTLDHPGPLTRSVYDAAVTMDYITGYDPKDPCLGRYKGEKINFSEGLDKVKDVKGIKIGIPANFYFDKTDYEIEKLVRDAISNFEKLGAQIIDVEIPFLDRVPEVSTIIMFSEAAAYHKDNLALVSHPEEYTPAVRERLEQGMNYKATDYVSALQEREKILSSWSKAISQVDIVVAPTLPIPAFKIGEKTVMTRGKEEGSWAMCTIHTRFANTAGCPALTVPCGLTSEGLPAGMMIMGRNYEDNTVLKAGYAYEKHYPYRFKQF